MVNDIVDADGRPNYNEARWALFQSLYKGLKMEAQAECNQNGICACTYLPASENPIVYNPLDMPSDEYAMANLVDEEIEAHCDGLCPEKVEQWTNKILALDCIEASKIDLDVLRYHLSILCDDLCGMDDPMVFLTEEVVDGSYFKDNIIPIINQGGCSDFKEIISPVTYTTVCDKEWVVNECFDDGYYFSAKGERKELMESPPTKGRILQATECSRILVDAIEELIHSNTTKVCGNSGFLGGMYASIGEPIWSNNSLSMPITLPASCVFGGNYDGEVLVGLGLPNYSNNNNNNANYLEVSWSPGPNFGGSTSKCDVNPADFITYYAPNTHVNERYGIYFYIQDCGSTAKTYLKFDNILSIGDPFTVYDCSACNMASPYLSEIRSECVAVEIVHNTGGTVITETAYIEVVNNKNELHWKEEQEVEICESGWNHNAGPNMRFDGCEYVFYDAQTGNQLRMDDQGIANTNTSTILTDLVYSITEVAKVNSSPLGASVGGLKFQHAAAKVTYYGGREVIAYIYSSCDENSLLVEVERCYTTSMGPTSTFVETIDWTSLQEECVESMREEATYWANETWQTLVDEFLEDYLNGYITHCMNSLDENFYYSVETSEHHYTLYYYDQAGNLVQTVPPQGVEDDFSNININSAGEYVSGNPVHELTTNYQYNSLNQLIIQTTPDGGTSQFFYDSKGQLRLSQNEKQASTNYYSYTKYDALGRIIEVGEVQNLPGSHTPAYFNTPAGVEKLDGQSFPRKTAYQCADITETLYDATGTGAITQENLRGRVSEVSTWQPKSGGWQSGGGYERLTMTTYSYDAHGNVNNMLQSIREMEPKLVSYEYDLVSGNVNYVYYQKGNARSAHP